MNDFSIFPDNESFALYLAGPFISAVLAYYGLHFALAVIEWIIDRVASLLEPVRNHFGRDDDDGDGGFEGYADMDLPQIEGLLEVESGEPSLHRRSA